MHRLLSGEFRLRVFLTFEGIAYLYSDGVLSVDMLDYQFTELSYSVKVAGYGFQTDLR